MSLYTYNVSPSQTMTLELAYAVTHQMGEVIAATKCPEEAAMLIACLGSGYSIEYMGRKVWREGFETQPASESYDFVAELVYARS